MDKRFVCTAAAVLLVTVCTALLVRSPEQPQSAPLQETVSGVERPAPPQHTEPAPPQPEEYAYIVREYEGRVAVFSADNETEPEMVLETLVKYLPDYDRSQMQEGIKVSDYKELVALIEDFVS